MTKPIPILGIDLGTTKSVVAIWNPEAKKAEPIPNSEMEEITPSVVTFHQHEVIPIVGSQAEHEMLTHPEDVVYSVKRILGLAYDDKRVAEMKSLVTYHIEGTADNKTFIRLSYGIVPPVEVSSHILAKLKRDAEKHLGMPVEQAVVTVPAYFTESQRHATILAGEHAGFKVRRLINEPTAAALAFNLQPDLQNIMVYDLGGGTFDVSILQIEDGGYRVVATSGNTLLGGDDFDKKIVDWIKEQYRQKYESSLLAIPTQEALLREEARQAKITLSENSQSILKLPPLRLATGSSQEENLVLTRKKFTELVQSKIDETLGICDKALDMAEAKSRQFRHPINRENISQILLVGGQTITPAVREALTKKYGWKLNTEVKPSHAVALGAAIQAGYLSGDPYLKQQIRLRDVVAQPLGIEIAGGALRVLIEANQEIPTSSKNRDERFRNERDGERVDLLVYQGHSPVAKQNTFLGKVALPLAGPRKKGEATLQVWFEIGYDSILEVHAKELGVESQEVNEKIDFYYYLNQFGHT